MADIIPNGAPSGAAGSNVHLEDFSEEFHPILQKLIDNVKIIGIAIGGLILLIGILGVYNYTQSQAQAKAAQTIGLIQLKEVGEDRIAALDEFMAEAPANFIPAIRLDKARTAMIIQKWDLAIPEWRSLMAGQDANMATVATLGLSQCLLQKGQIEEALTELTALKSKAPEAYQTLVTNTLAMVSETAGKDAEALALYKELQEKNKELDLSFVESKIQDLEQRLSSKS